MIYEILGEGLERAKTAREIQDLLGMTRREVTRQVERERRDGIPICASVADPRGYYLAATKEEMEGYCKALEHRQQEVGRTLAGCQKSLGAIPFVPPLKERDSQGGSESGGYPGRQD